MVPMLTCGLLRSNFAFATAVLLRTLLMRHATSGTDSFRSSGRWWMDLDPVLGRTRTRDGGGSIFPHHPDCAGYGWPRCGATPHPGLLQRSLARRFGDHTARLRGELRASVAGAPSCPHSPVAFAMISFATLAGTSA